MTWNTALLAAVMTFVAAGAQAQAVYRAVGPDGKTVFSDHPPVNGNANMSVTGKPGAQQPQRPASGALLPSGLRANSPEAARAAAAAAALAAAEDDRKSGPKRNLPVGDPPQGAVYLPPPATATGSSLPDPALGKAVYLALITESLVTQMEDICLRAAPASKLRYAVADSWKQRNLALLNKMRMALADSFAGAQRVSMNVAMKVQVENTLGPVGKAAPDSRIRWCDRAAEDIAKGVMDLSANPEVAASLATFQPK